MKDFFKQIDADQNGTISKSEFETALGAGGSNLAMAGSVFGKLDAAECERNRNQDNDGQGDGSQHGDSFLMPVFLLTGPNRGLNH